MNDTNSFLGIDGSRSSLVTMISRLVMFIEDETEQIKETPNFDFKSSSERKSRLLFELNRTCRGMDMTRLDSNVLHELSRLKSALALNEARIRAHLTAVKEISTIMVNILRNEDADGTYGKLV